MNLKEMFENNEDEFLMFDRVENKLSTRADLHAFILLDKLVPSTHDMVSGAEHDEIFLSTDTDELAKIASEDQIRDLVRCGIRFDSLHDSLAMFV